MILYLFSKVSPFGSRILRKTVKAGFFVIFLVSVFSFYSLLWRARIINPIELEDISTFTLHYKKLN